MDVYQSLQVLLLLSEYFLFDEKLGFQFHEFSLLGLKGYIQLGVVAPLTLPLLQLALQV